MLSESSVPVSCGYFTEELHLPGTAKHELFEFIIAELPRWRDHPQRPTDQAETVLTSALCSHLNTAARFSVGWSRIQFLPEEPDETVKGRKIDFAPKPLGATIVIEGRRHTQFEKLFPIECKRLPTPTGQGRDPREYVFVDSGTTGGMQRFKEGVHGASHSFGGMIAFIQEESCDQWFGRVNGWITALAQQELSGWTTRDELDILRNDESVGVSAYCSMHQRTTAHGTIELRHAWIKMC
jgi:hypothetical protein